LSLDLDRINSPRLYLRRYSSNSEISRARTNFFNGKKSFLVVTERFHFFRRYKIRGARTVVFYAPPEHADFYAEFLQYPFLRREVSGASKNRPEAEAVEEVLEANEVVSQTVFSKYDFLRLERIVGTPDAKRMAKSEQGERFSFV
jgi:U3 small nucleolar RNA-associated protein 25